MQKSDFKVGNTVWLKIIEGSNRARYSNINPNDVESWIVEATVENVGSKFISVKIRGTQIVKFNIKNNFHQIYVCGGADYKLYLSKQDVLNDIESENIYQEIKNDFMASRNHKKLSLEQLRKIKEILDDTKGE